MGVRGGTELGGAGRSLIMGRDRVEKRKQQETSRKINWDQARKHAELLKTSEPAGPECKLQEKSLALVVQALIILLKMHMYTPPFFSLCHVSSIQEHEKSIRHMMT